MKKKHTHSWRQATKLKDTHCRQVNIGHHQENSGVLCIADPHLGSVDNVVIFVLLSTSLQRESIAPRLCFWEAETSNLSQTGKQQAVVRVNVAKIQGSTAYERQWGTFLSVCGGCSSCFVALAQRDRVQLTMSVDSRLRYFSFWAGVPSLLISVLISVFWMSQSTATDGSTLASSSMTRMEEKKEAPVPPYSGSISMPMSCEEAKQ